MGVLMCQHRDDKTTCLNCKIEKALKEASELICEIDQCKKECRGKYVSRPTKRKVSKNGSEDGNLPVAIAGN